MAPRSFPRGLPAAVAAAALALAVTACAQPAASLAPQNAGTSTEVPAQTLAPSRTPAPSPTEAPPNASPTAEPVTAATFNAQAYQWRPVVSGLGPLTHLTHAGDGSGRLFVVEQEGRIRVVQNGGLLDQPFLDITSLVGSDASERGLLSVAFHPDYETNGLFYVDYTDKNGDTVVARYSVSADPNVADPASGTPILQIDQPYPNHNGGQLLFGPDGYLYVGMGDGGAGGDPQGNAQNLGTLLGKLLRLDVNAGDGYGVPPSNPFVGRGGALGEIWAYGLRNPWRFSFDRATGDLYIADVGQNAYEEVDFQPAGSAGGENYGWDFMEGSHPFEGGPQPGLVNPIAEYSHDDGCSITGGHVYRGPSLPELHGIYFYGDWCSGKIWVLSRNPDGGWSSAAAYETAFPISSFGEDEAGELYLVDSGGGVYRLERL